MSHGEVGIREIKCAANAHQQRRLELEHTPPVTQRSSTW